MSSIVFKSAKQHAIAIQKRSIKAIDLLEAYFEQIDKFNPAINAVIWQDRKAAKEIAWQIDKETAAGNFRGPLHGVPMTVKESFNLSGAPTTWGDPKNIHNIATTDSDAVARLRSAGAIVLSKQTFHLILLNGRHSIKFMAQPIIPGIKPVRLEVPPEDPRLHYRLV